MWNLYLDESGDLGFDFVTKKPSNFFTITILALSSIESNSALIGAVKKTLKRKLFQKAKTSKAHIELKGSMTDKRVKSYFFQQIRPIQFGVYTITLNKRRVYETLIQEKERLYNYMARLVIDQIPFELNQGCRVNMYFDKCKAKPEIKEFNKYIRRNIESRLEPNIPIDMYHVLSDETLGLQACDMCSWAIFQKYERKNTQWMECFSDKIKFDELYLSQRE